MSSRLTEISHACFGYGLAVKQRYNLRDKLLGFLVCARPIFLILTPLNAASAAVLALGGFPSLTQCLLGFVTVALASAAVNSFNGYVDHERDKLIWQTRPIPSGRIRPNEAFIMVAFFFLTSLVMSWFVFNPATFAILFVAVVLGGLYSAYLRDRVGYFSLPPIVGLIYLGGWSAFSPETLFTSLLPWYLYLLGFVWQAAHIMVLYPVHIPDNARPAPELPPAFFFTPSPRTAVVIGTVFTGLTLLMSALLPLKAPVGTLYLILVLVAGIYALVSSASLVKDPLNREKILKAFAVLSVFRLTISVAILLTILLTST
ncbi:MAG: UbiA family prenyltransferase [Dehalococcoidia bacterium]|nr:UbiA family prenyltransferase [Dehalococcoidia bacterium]